MFTTIKHFEKNWLRESKTTQSVMDALTDESLGQKVAEDHRTLGRMAWHIVLSIPDMMAPVGLSCDGISPKDALPKTAKEIRDAYAHVSSQLMTQVKTGWNDDALFQEDDMYGEKWAKGVTLFILLNHEIHHRGQMTVLMRQAGLKVPDIYGPAMEGWEKYGAPAPEI